MRSVRIGMLACLAALLAAVPAPAQGIQQGVRAVGAGPSLRFEYELPTGRIERTLGDMGAYTRGGEFFIREGPAGVSYLAAPGIMLDLRRSGWEPLALRGRGTDASPAQLFTLRIRTIDSLQFERRARFAKLRETMLALAERIRQADAQSLGQISTGLRELMFPMPIQDGGQAEYGFFSRVDLVGGGAAGTERLLAPFTPEVQKSLGEERFLDTAHALLFGRPLPEGMGLDQLYDPQLASLGNYLFNNGRYEAAARVWEELVRRDHTSALRRRGLALCLFASRQVLRAAKEIRLSLTLAPGWPDQTRFVGSNLQDVFPAPRELAEARDELLAQLQAKPDDADLQFLAALVDLFHGKWDAARARLEQLAPADEVARLVLERVKADALDKTIQRPTASVLRQLAEDLTGLEEPTLTPEARAKMIAVLREGPQTHEDYMRLGDFRFFMGDYTQAAEAYRAAHKARPEDPFPLFALTHASFANGEFGLAARYLKRALALEPGWGLYEFRIQEFYGDQEEYRRHVRNLERQVELRAMAADARFLLAYIYYFSGRYADATDLLAQVLRLEPDFERAEYFLRLARLQG